MPDTAYIPQHFATMPVCMRIGAEQNSLNQLVGGLSTAISNHRENTGPFQVLDMSLHDGSLSCSLVDGYRTHVPDADSPIMISGIHADEESLQAAKSQLSQRNALGRVAALDAGATVANVLRNRLNCVGRGDLVLYAHAAYPHHLPAFKLPRMVDRLADMVSDQGAVMTLHNHGTSDVDLIRQHMLHLPHFSSPGRDCGTQKKLENAFGMASSKLHAFSVTIPNIVKVPANSKAVAAIFQGREAALMGDDAIAAGKIRNVLEVIAGSAEELNASIAKMSDEYKQHAQDFFSTRSQMAKNGEIALTVGGGHMLVGSRSLDVAKSMFDAIREAAEQMAPPALVVPLNPALAPTCDKGNEHANWLQHLRAEHGIAHPPQVNAIAVAAERQR